MLLYVHQYQGSLVLNLIVIFLGLQDFLSAKSNNSVLVMACNDVQNLNVCAKLCMSFVFMCVDVCTCMCVCLCFRDHET